MAIHSHVQIPKVILKNFRDESDLKKPVHYLDIHAGKIWKKPAKRLGTSKGYYSIEGENFWGQYIESPLGVLNKKIQDFCAGNSQILIITREDTILARNYIKAAAIRSKLAADIMQKTSYTAHLHTDQENHDALSFFGMDSEGEFDHLLQEYRLTVLINKSDRSFVVPQNCFYSVLSKSKIVLVAPISPKMALLLLPAEYKVDTGETYGIVKDPENIETMNIAALRYEYQFKGTFVASNCYSELEMLQCYRTEHLEELINLMECHNTIEQRDPADEKNCESS